MREWSLGNVLLTIGLLWGALGFIIWLSMLSTLMVVPGPEVVRDLIYFVLAPTLLFIFGAIISFITDVRSGV